MLSNIHTYIGTDSGKIERQDYLPGSSFIHRRKAPKSSI
jgi:hypothetical protein